MSPCNGCDDMPFDFPCFMGGLDFARIMSRMVGLGGDWSVSGEEVGSRDVFDCFHQKM